MYNSILPPHNNGFPFPKRPRVSLQDAGINVVPLNNIVFGCPNLDTKKFVENIIDGGDELVNTLDKMGLLGLILKQEAPKNDSNVTRDELARIAHSIQNLTPQEVAFCMAVDKDVASIFSEYMSKALGMRIERNVFEDVAKKASPLCTFLKSWFNRARPFQLAAYLNAEVNPIIAEIHSPSYPSGHAFKAYMMAYKATSISPAHSQEFLNLAAEIGRSRITAGVHYPSDVEFAKTLAEVLWEKSLCGDII